MVARPRPGGGGFETVDRQPFANRLRGARAAGRWRRGRRLIESTDRDLRAPRSFCFGPNASASRVGGPMPALDDTRSSAPVLTFHLLFGTSGRVLPIRAHVFAHVSGGVGRRGVWSRRVWISATRWWRSWRINTSCLSELIVRRSSSDEARWASA